MTVLANCARLFINFLDLTTPYFVFGISVMGYHGTCIKEDICYLHRMIWYMCKWIRFKRGCCSDMIGFGVLYLVLNLYPTSLRLLSSLPKFFYQYFRRIYSYMTELTNVWQQLVCLWDINKGATGDNVIDAMAKYSGHSAIVEVNYSLTQIHTFLLHYRVCSE